MTLLKNSLGIMALLLAFTAAAADPIYTNTFSNKAVRGHDVVAYFTEGKPVKGSKKHSIDWMGARWQFASASNLAAFEADPNRYAPQYGGYCAYAVSKGTTASGDPDNWTIVDGKLYLNYNDGVQEIWEADIPLYTSLADANWPRVLK
ncbi:MAG: YHS domain protein [Gammaproteobacteria bacterium]|nr:YHS domain protein [Gammaproteobacteria bacterium]